MALKNVRWEPDDEAFRIEGGGSFTFDDGDLVIPLDVAGDVSLAHLTRAIEHVEDYYGESANWIIFVDSDSSWQPPAAQFATALAESSDGELTAVVSVSADEQLLRPPELAELVAPLLSQHRARWRSSWVNEERSYFVGRMISASLTGARRSVRELAELSAELQEFCNAVSGYGELNVSVARNLLATGRISLLLGQPESSWLDAKRIPYKMGSDAERWELAKDVAAFANSGKDAIILVGATTQKAPNGDVLQAGRPFDLNEMDVPAVRACLRDRIVPLIPDLDVGVVEVRNGFGYGWIRIPAQPPELRPFLVAGALTGAGYLGAHIAIPFRAIEDTAYLDAAAVHSLVAAGRAALRNLS
jgi:hypothetical protein